MNSPEACEQEVPLYIVVECVGDFLLYEDGKRKALKRPIDLVGTAGSKGHVVPPTLPERREDKWVVYWCWRTRLPLGSERPGDAGRARDGSTWRGYTHDSSNGCDLGANEEDAIAWVLAHPPKLWIERCAAVGPDTECWAWLFPPASWGVLVEHRKRTFPRRRTFSQAPIPAQCVPEQES